MLLLLPLLGCHRPYPATRTPAGPVQAAAADREAPSPPDLNDEPDRPPPARLLSEAQRELSLVRVSHVSMESQIDEPKGVFEYTSSGFVDYALSIAAPEALVPLDRLMNGTRPTVKTYVTLLASLAPGETRGPWMRIGNIVDLAPGDVVAWLKPALLEQDQAGHIAIVESAPVPRGLAEWIVPIIDSSRGHGGADPRHEPDATGLGRGTMVLVASRGVPFAYRWTAEEDVRDSLMLETTIVMGRLR